MATLARNAPPAARDAAIPPLENGDNLDVHEFLRRYEAMPDDCDAELIEGIVYMASPVSQRRHSRPHTHANYWLVHYARFTRGVDTGDNATTRLDLGNAPQPDLLLRIPESAGGSSREDGDYIEGPPELVVEVAASSASVDLNQKYTAYARNRVAEYLVWRTRDRALDWFALDGGEYRRLAADPADGLLKSEVFPGLWLDADALISGDLPRLAAAVERGCATPPHAAFARKLTAG